MRGVFICSFCCWIWICLAVKFLLSWGTYFCQYPVSTEVCLLASSNSNVPADPNWQALIASMLVFIRAEQGLRLTMPSLGSLNWQEDSGRLLLKIRARVGAGYARVRELRWAGRVVGVFHLCLGNLEDWDELLWNIGVRKQDQLSAFLETQPGTSSLIAEEICLNISVGKWMLYLASWWGSYLKLS